MRLLVPIAQRDRKEESGLGIAQPELVYQCYAEAGESNQKVSMFYAECVSRQFC